MLKIISIFLTCSSLSSSDITKLKILVLNRSKYAFLKIDFFRMRLIIHSWQFSKHCQNFNRNFPEIVNSKVIS
jgi:hypothetical protein